MKILLLIFLMTFSAFSYAELPEWMKNQPVVDHFVWDSIKPFNGNNIEVIRSFSKVIHEEESIYIDPYHKSEVGAKRYIFHFSGIKVKGFYIPGKSFFIEYVEVITPKFILAGGIKVGSSESDLVTHFEQKGTKNENSITFSGESENVVFTLENGIVIKVQIYGYTG